MNEREKRTGKKLRGGLRGEISMNRRRKSEMQVYLNPGGKEVVPTYLGQIGLKREKVKRNKYLGDGRAG